MDNININKSKSSRKIIQNKIPKYNVDKRKSDGIAENVFLNKNKGNHSNKLNKIPINHRLSIQDSNKFAFSKLISNLKPDTNEKPKKKDKEYYLQLLNNIYSNDSHLSNKNVMEIGNEYYLKKDIIGFTHKLIQVSENLWEKKDVIVDDITAVIIFF